MATQWTSFFAILFTVLLATPLNAETLLVLGDDAYAPVIHNKDGKPSGFLPAILQRVALITGDQYEVRLSPWKRAYEMAARGDGGLVGVSFTQERSKTFDFSKPVYDDDIQIITLKDRTFSFTKLDDLKGKVIGGVNGASYGEEVDRAIAAGLFTIDRDVGQAGRLRKLLAGRLDAAFIGNGNSGFDGVVASAKELSINRERFAILPTPLTRDPLHLAFAKTMNKKAAIERFDEAVEKLRRSGELRKILSTAN